MPRGRKINPRLLRRGRQVRRSRARRRLLVPNDPQHKPYFNGQSQGINYDEPEPEASALLGQNDAPNENRQNWRRDESKKRRS